MTTTGGGSRTPLRCAIPTDHDGGVNHMLELFHMQPRPRSGRCGNRKGESGTALQSAAQTLHLLWMLGRSAGAQRRSSKDHPGTYQRAMTPSPGMVEGAP